MKPDEKTAAMLKAISVTLSGAVMDLVVLKVQLVGLLEHLKSPDGKTDANCRAVDSFFCLNDSWSEKGLSEDFYAVLADMGVPFTTPSRILRLRGISSQRQNNCLREQRN